MHKLSRSVKACGCILVRLSPAHGIHDPDRALGQGYEAIGSLTHARLTQHPELRPAARTIHGHHDRQWLPKRGVDSAADLQCGGGLA